MKANQTLKLKDNDRAEANLVRLTIGLVIGVSLVATVAFEASEAQNNSSVTGAADSLLGLVALIFVAIIIYGAYRHVKG